MSRSKSKASINLPWSSSLLDFISSARAPFWELVHGNSFSCTPPTDIILPRCVDGGLDMS